MVKQDLVFEMDGVTYRFYGARVSGLQMEDVEDDYGMRRPRQEVRMVLQYDFFEVERGRRVKEPEIPTDYFTFPWEEVPQDYQPGFRRPPAPPKKREWRDVLGFNVFVHVSMEAVEAAYKKLVLVCHPDQGGTHELMVELNLAMDQAKKELGG